MYVAFKNQRFNNTALFLSSCWESKSNLNVLLHIAKTLEVLTNTPTRACFKIKVSIMLGSTSWHS